MTLLDTQRLVRKISSLSAEPFNLSITSKLADDFANACRAANLRLGQCESMIKAGDRQQAIQSAETSPALLDWITVLEFQGAEDWRKFCAEKGLQVAEHIDARAVEALNNCYSQGITTDHPLYGVYRKAVLSRNDEEAFKVLRTIVRLNPADANAASELARLDAKLFQTRLQHLADIINTASPEIIIAEVTAIENFGFKGKPTGPVWQNAQTIRCGQLLEEAEILEQASDWQECLTKLELLAALQREHNIEFRSASTQRIERVNRWAREQHARDKQEREFNVLLAELHYRVENCKQAMARRSTTKSLKLNLFELNSVWESLQKLGRQIPEAVASSFSESSNKVQTILSKRATVRLAVTSVSVLAVLLTAGLFIRSALIQQKAKRIVVELSRAINDRKVHATEALLGEIANGGQALLAIDGVRSLNSSAEEFLKKEKKSLSNYVQVVGTLPTVLKHDEGQNSQELQKIGDRWRAAQNAYKALPSDFRSEHEREIKSFEERWREFTANESGATTKLIKSALEEAERLAEEFSGPLSLDVAHTSIAGLSNQVELIEQFTSGVTNVLSIGTELLQRYEVTRSNYLIFSRELSNVDLGQTKLKAARSTTDYLEAVNSIASSQFKAWPVVQAANEVRALNPTEEATVALLLGITNSEVLNALKNDQGKTLFFPDTLDPHEQLIFDGLIKDPALDPSLRKVRFYVSGTGDVVDWITVGSLEANEGWKEILGMNPKSTLEHPRFVTKEYGLFSGQYKLSPTMLVSRVENLGFVEDAKPFYSLGLNDGLPVKNHNLGTSVLKMLDTLKASEEGSSIFRAYLFLQLNDILSVRPAAWGSAFAPDLNVHSLKIKEAYPGTITSADWLYPSLVESKASKMRELLHSLQTISYEKQARGLYALDHNVYKAGLTFLGFVELDGTLNLKNGLLEDEAWCFTKNRKPTKVETSGGTVSAAYALPLSPLYCLPLPKKDFLIRAQIDLKDPCFVNSIPSLFKKEKN